MDTDTGWDMDINMDRDEEREREKERIRTRTFMSTLCLVHIGMTCFSSDNIFSSIGLKADCQMSDLAEIFFYVGAHLQYKSE